MNVVIAGGGTGGHLFPGIAVAEEFLKRNAGTRVIFIGTKKGIEDRLLKTVGYELKTVDIEGIKGRGINALIKAMFKIPKSLWQSRRILKQCHADIVLGVGGYASGPAVLAARLMGVPTAIAEQNAIPGATNRILSYVADRIFVTYEQSKQHWPARKVVFSGNPVRASFAGNAVRKREKKDYRQLLIFGGSQGAETINRGVVDMLPLLQSIKEKIEVRMLHQTGLRQAEEVKKAYEHFGIHADVTPFIVDMAGAYAAADLIICRAGATSLAEITVAGKASVLIPYPWAANDHQRKNALALSEAGAAVMIPNEELTGSRLFHIVKDLLADETKLCRMEESALALGKPDAASVIVDECMKLAQRRN